MEGLQAMMVRTGLVACMVVLIGCAHQNSVGGGGQILRV